MSMEDILDKELIKKKQLADFLKEQYQFFFMIKKGAIIQGQIENAIEKLVEPHVSKITVLKQQGLLK